MTGTPNGDATFVRRHRGYPGRDQLDAVNMQFRRAVARLAREGTKDPATAAKLAPIIAEAVGTLERLTAQAIEAEGNSARNRAAMERAQANVDRLTRKLARRGGAPRG